MPTMADCALRLADRGLAVFPCLPRSKRPATVNGLKDATVVASKILAWWHRQPAYNIGLACGAISNIFVVDVDDDDSGEAELRRLEAQHGELPPTVEAITARGRHIFFRHPGWPIKNAVAFLPGVDIRGDGGYVVAPPSLHPSGRRYAWSVDSASAFADAPPWVLDRLQDRTRDVAPAAEWREITSQGVEQGQRNNTVARLAGHLLARDVDSLVVLDLLIAFGQARCRPPLSEAEVTRTVNSIARLEIRRRNV